MKSTRIERLFLMGLLTSVALPAAALSQAECEKTLSADRSTDELSRKAVGTYACTEQEKDKLAKIVASGFNAEDMATASVAALRMRAFEKKRSLSEDIANACRFIVETSFPKTKAVEAYSATLTRHVMDCAVNEDRWASPQVEKIRRLILTRLKEGS